MEQQEVRAPVTGAMSLVTTFYFIISSSTNIVLNTWKIEIQGITDGIITLLLCANMAQEIYNTGIREDVGRKLILFLESFPFDFIAYFIFGGVGHKIFYPIRCARLADAYRILTADCKDTQNISRNLVIVCFKIIPIFATVFWMLVMIHIITILRIATIDDSNAHYIDATYQVLYTVTAVGYGDMELEYSSTANRIFASATCLVSVVVNAYIVGYVVAQLSSLDVNEEQEQKLMETLAVLEYFNIPKSLSQEVLSFQAYNLKTKIGGSSSAVNGLPSVMQREISLYSRVKLICSVPLFSDEPLECQEKLAELLYTVSFAPNEIIITAQEVGQEMYFLCHGFVGVSLADGTYVSTLRPGNTFGELALLMAMPRSATVKSLTYAECFMLKYADFAVIENEFCGFRKKMIEEGKHIIKMFNHETDNLTEVGNRSAKYRPNLTVSIHDELFSTAEARKSVTDLLSTMNISRQQSVTERPSASKKLFKLRDKIADALAVDDDRSNIITPDPPDVLLTSTMKNVKICRPRVSVGNVSCSTTSSGTSDIKFSGRAHPFGDIMKRDTEEEEPLRNRLAVRTSDFHLEIDYTPLVESANRLLLQVKSIDLRILKLSNCTPEMPSVAGNRRERLKSNSNALAALNLNLGSIDRPKKKTFFS